MWRVVLTPPPFPTKYICTCGTSKDSTQHCTCNIFKNWCKKPVAYKYEYIFLFSKNSPWESIRNDRISLYYGYTCINAKYTQLPHTGSSRIQNHQICFLFFISSTVGHWRQLALCFKRSLVLNGSLYFSSSGVFCLFCILAVRNVQNLE